MAWTAGSTSASASAHPGSTSSDRGLTCVVLMPPTLGVSFDEPVHIRYTLPPACGVLAMATATLVHGTRREREL